MKTRFVIIGILTLACFINTKTVNAQSKSEVAAVAGDMSVFSNSMGLELKKKVQLSDIDKIQNEQIRDAASQIFKKQYDPKYRMATYEAYLQPTTLGTQLLIGDGYSKYENMTGIYLPVGKSVVLVENIAKGKKINLLIPNWNRRAPEGTDPTKDPAGWGIVKQTFPLHNGINIIDVNGFDGLAYIDYYSDKPESEVPVKVHFINGKVNGYFDVAKDQDEDWNRLIDNAIYPIIDARGRHIQIAYPAADCKKYAYNRGVELISNYDSLVYREQRLLGLIKYNRVPKNRILARVNYNYYMFRDGDGVAYMGTSPNNAMSLVVNPSSVIKDDPCWGFAHEVGHVHQLRPYFNWGGLGEVSNNVFTMYVTTSFGNESRLAQQKKYKIARDSIINKKISYLQDNDVFNRLVPFWQLQLYFSREGNQKDFYPDLFEAFRQQGAEDIQKKKVKTGGGWGARGSNPAGYQLNFIIKACEVGQTDLTDFFDQYGFFYLGKFRMDDYGNYQYNMTQKMVDDCKAAVKAMNLPKAKVDVSRLED